MCTDRPAPFKRGRRNQDGIHTRRYIIGFFGIFIFGLFFITRLFVRHFVWRLKEQEGGHSWLDLYNTPFATPFIFYYHWGIWFIGYWIFPCEDSHEVSWEKQMHSKAYYTVLLIILSRRLRQHTFCLCSVLWVVIILDLYTWIKPDSFVQRLNAHKYYCSEYVMGRRLEKKSKKK